MDWVLKSIITDEFRNNVYDENWSRNPDEYNKQGMLMAFTIGSSDPMVLERSEEEQYCRYPKRELFIWGPMNYIGVFTRDTMMHPDVFSPWYILSYHDSCWREDGIGRFLNYVGNCSSLCGPLNHWYEKIPVPDDCRKLVEEYPGHERHPVIR